MLLIPAVCKSFCSLKWCASGSDASSSGNAKYLRLFVDLSNTREKRDAKENDQRTRGRGDFESPDTGEKMKEERKNF